MLQNYLKIALRSLFRQKSYAFINVIGLAVGLTCTLLICLHIADDVSFDRFHAKSERIFRFTQWAQDSQTPANTAPAWAGALTADIPQIEATTRFYEGFNEALMSVGEIKLYEKRVKFADANVFDVFDFPLVQGNKRTALI
jgi:putative ABC transport system permease protein